MPSERTNTGTTPASVPAVVPPSVVGAGATSLPPCEAACALPTGHPDWPHKFPPTVCMEQASQSEDTCQNCGLLLENHFASTAVYCELLRAGHITHQQFKERMGTTPPVSEVASPSGEETAYQILQRVAAKGFRIKATADTKNPGVEGHPIALDYLESGIDSVLSSLRRDRDHLEWRVDDLKSRHKAALEAERQRAVQMEETAKDSWAVQIKCEGRAKAAEAEASSLRRSNELLRAKIDSLQADAGVQEGYCEDHKRERDEFRRHLISRDNERPSDDERIMLLRRVCRGFEQEASSLRQERDFHSTVAENLKAVLAEKERQLQEAQARIARLTTMLGPWDQAVLDSELPNV